MNPHVPRILQACRLFASIGATQRDRLERMARVRQLRRGQAVFHQGDPCPGVFIVGTGLVRVYRLALSGKEHVLHVVGPGGTFAEVAAIGGFACPASAQALSAGQVLLLPRKPFTQALNEDHDLCLQLLAGMAGWVHHLVDLMENLVLRDALARVARHLAALRADADGLIRLPAGKRHLASHLNLTSETLARTLGRLRDAGLIQPVGPRSLRVLDRPALVRVSRGR